MNIDVSIKYNFQVSSREFTLIIKALNAYGGNGAALAQEMERLRLIHQESIADQFRLFIDSKDKKNEKS